MKIKENKSVKELLNIKIIALYILVGVLSFGIDKGLFYLLSTFVFNAEVAQQIFLSTWIARIASGIFNFLLLNFIVFPVDKSLLAGKAFKYVILWTINCGASGLFTYIFRFVPTSLLFLKIIVDSIIAIANYVINRIWVFSKAMINKNKTMPME